MINADLHQLVRALEPTARQALEQAAERCVARGGREILVEDLLLCLATNEQSFLNAALRQFQLDHAALLTALHHAGERAVPGEHSPVFSADLVQWLQEAYLLSTLELHLEQVPEGCLLLALLNNPGDHAHRRCYAVLADIPKDKLRQLIGGMLESQPGPSSAVNSALQQFTTNFTQLARDGSIDPVLGREGEIRQMIDILARRRKNNPIVVGDAGVGKTAVVEGLALKVASNEVPPVLENVEILALDMGLLQAGASVKGEFERRLQAVIEGVKTSATPVVLFIDEAHTLIGAGGQAGGNDAANLLKPALARGELRTIAATTWSEYKKYIEKDPALARRFQPVQLDEPDPAQAVAILRGLAPHYQQTHGVYLRDDAVVAAAELSARYISGRQLPDKAVDVLDTACARVRISLNSRPAELEALHYRQAGLQRELDARQRDHQAGLMQNEEELSRLAEQVTSLAGQAEATEQLWQQQKALAEQLLALRRQDTPDPAQLQALQQQLAELQQSQRLVHYEVSARLVAEVISAWTGIPVGNLVQQRSQQVMHFGEHMQQRIRGQQHAIDALNRSVRASATGISNPDAPDGVFLLVGPSGTGKTETALAMADLLYGGDRFLTTINMSEFQEKHTVSRLIGSPPGYVGFGEGGMLTDAVRQRPYSVVLLDEVEKADKDVLNLFYQIFDKGMANDGEGRATDFRHCTLLLTSNLGSDIIEQLCRQQPRPDPAELLEAIRPVLTRHFKPALLARMTVVPYYPIDDGTMAELVKIKLDRLGQRLRERRITLACTPEVISAISQRCTHSDSGARNIDHVLREQLMPLISDTLLQAQADNQASDTLVLSWHETDGFACRSGQQEIA
ncbi:type VI secretion system ATPase TssH [Oceanimonas baumannii]|uniref:ClpV1 family T6SS ATPase n=1 Tax=Oceanimonas baumannii TaxID=129578 RepID=A0A235C8Z2_9GAMM|nr:type VI secretion system ATPase TssH [Oceanimonas baumannii]OYD21098.1 ClpV1 family T6SS ATPase [Oceanimonas baumannii]TDW54025.1 type VI secretion system protein VasG [Oceanimonas baumannii]